MGAAQELIAIQQSGPRDIGFFGTRNMGFLHQQLIEILSYAMVLTVCGGESKGALLCRRAARRALTRAARRTSRPQENHIFTSGATGTNAAVIRGARNAAARHLVFSRPPPERSDARSRRAPQARCARSGRTC